MRSRTASVVACSGPNCAAQLERLQGSPQIAMEELIAWVRLSGIVLAGLTLLP
jgi:hypothetical protein